MHPNKPSPLGISPCSQIPSQNCLPTTHQSQALNEYIYEHIITLKKNKMVDGLHGNHVRTLQSTIFEVVFFDIFHMEAQWITCHYIWILLFSPSWLRKWIVLELSQTFLTIYLNSLIPHCSTICNMEDVNNSQSIQK